MTATLWNTKSVPRGKMIVIVRNSAPHHVAAHCIWKEMYTEVHIELRRIRVSPQDNDDNPLTRLWLKEYRYEDSDGFMRWAYVGTVPEEEARKWMGVGR